MLSKLYLARISLVAFPLLMFICLGSCVSHVVTPTRQSPYATAVPPTTEPYLALTPPSNFGLYVEMNDRYSNAEAYPAVSKKSKGYKFSQRLYIFDSAEPITVTATVIVFGVGELATSDCGYKEYRISIINEQGQDVVRPNALSGSRQCILGIGVDHETPQIQTFRIDDVANLSSGGAFTMTLARWVWVGEERYLLEGNPVRFRVRTP